MNKNLLVRVDRDEIDPADVRSYHTVDGIVSAAADSCYFNVYAAFEILIKFKWHRYVLRIFRILIFSARGTSSDMQFFRAFLSVCFYARLPTAIAFYNIIYLFERFCNSFIKKSAIFFAFFFRFG